MATGSSVWAASTWNFGTGSGTLTAPTATAWSNDGAGSTFTTATLNTWSGGLGIDNGQTGENTNPQHSIDNQGNTDLVSLKFGSSVKLESVTIGWSSTDSDISVLAYTGTNPPANISGLTVSNLTSNGWTLVGSYADLVVGTAKTITNAANISSSWWLVSAYNSGFGSSSNSSSSGLTNGNDYVKLLAVAGSVTTPPPPTGQVSEPATMALFGLALLGSLAARRRKAG